MPEFEINLFENVSWEMLGPIPKIIVAIIVFAIIFAVIIPKKSLLNNIIGPVLGLLVIVVCFVALGFM